MDALAVLNGMLKSPMMRALQIENPQHRHVAGEQDRGKVVAHMEDLAFKPGVEIHFATISVKGQKVTILALQEPAAKAANQGK